MNETLRQQFVVDNQSLVVTRTYLRSQPVIIIDTLRRFTHSPFVACICPSLLHPRPLFLFFLLLPVLPIPSSSLSLFFLLSFPFPLSLSLSLSSTTLSSTTQHQALPGAGSGTGTVTDSRGNLLHTVDSRYLLLPQVGENTAVSSGMRE